jgi:hypothetical protein
MNQAEADLVRLKQEAHELRAKLAANEQKQGELVAYLKLLRVYGAELPKDKPIEKGTAVPAVSVTTSGAKRSPYGTMVAIVKMCGDILRETGRPWRTRDLLKELKARGLPVGGNDPMSNLSGRLGRSQQFRTHKTLGWHLAEWDDFPDPAEQKVAELREKLLLGHHGPVAGHGDRLENAGTFYGMGLPEAAVSILEKQGSPMHNREIAEQLTEKGFPLAQKDPESAVDIAIRRWMRSRQPRAREEPVVQVGPGTWGMASWFSSDQLAEFRATQSGMPNRDFREHLSRTRAGVAAAKARGVRFGTPSRYSGEDMAKAYELFASGMSNREVAQVFDMSAGGVGKWRKKWEAGKLAVLPTPNPNHNS